MALNEIVNHALPSRRQNKVYGRRKHNVNTTENLYQDTFGASSEDTVEHLFQRLAIGPIEQSKSHHSVVTTPHKKSGTSFIIAEDPHHYQGGKVEPIRTVKKRTSRIPNQTAQARKLHKIHEISEVEAAQLEPLLRLVSTKPQVKDFEELGSSIGKMYRVTKVGDGSYGECFLLKCRHSSSSISGVLKVIPFDLRRRKGRCAMSTVGDAVQEAKVLQALATVHGFAQLRSLYVVRGRYPETLLEASKSFELTRDDGYSQQSVVPRSDDQLHVVIEMEFAGTDIERLSSPSAFEAFDAFWMTTILLAKAEEQLEFEHRDLHMSNVCVQSDGHAARAALLEMKKKPSITLGLSGLKVSIIDYTMSRARLPGGEIVYRALGVESRPNKNMDDVEYHQRLTGLRMRECLGKRRGIKVTREPKEKTFQPRTNVIWLAHLLYGLLINGNSSRAGKETEPTISVAESISVSIWKQLEDVQGMIDREDLDMLPEGARELLVNAITKGWLTQEDIDSFGKRLEE